MNDSKLKECLKHLRALEEAFLSGVFDDVWDGELRYIFINFIINFKKAIEKNFKKKEDQTMTDVIVILNGREKETDEEEIRFYLKKDFLRNFSYSQNFRFLDERLGEQWGFSDDDFPDYRKNITSRADKSNLPFIREKIRELEDFYEESMKDKSYPRKEFHFTITN